MAFDVIVVGGGIAGGAAALRAAQYHLQTAWVRGDADTRKRSRGQWVVNVDNMIGIHDGITRRRIAKELERGGFAEAKAAIEAGHAHIGTRDIIDDVVERLSSEYASVAELIDLAASGASFADSMFSVQVPERSLSASSLVLATGVMDRQPSIKKEKRGELFDSTSWIYPFANRESVLYCIRCEGHLTASTHAAVIGSSPAAAEVALMLHERYGSTCAVLTNGEAVGWSSSSDKLLSAYGISVFTARIVDLSGAKGALNTIHLEGGAAVPVRFALVSMGLHRVYNDLAVALGAELTDPDEPLPVRHVKIDAFGETSVPGLFAVGDMARRPDEGVMKQIYTAQEYAVRAVDTIDRRRRRKLRAAVLGA